MKLKLAIYLSLYAAVIAFIAVGIEDSEARLGQKASIECKYKISKDGLESAKEYQLEINPNEIDKTSDSVYISLFIFNRGDEKLVLGPQNFILMENERELCIINTEKAVISPKVRKEMILAYPKNAGRPDCINVVKYGGENVPQKLFSIKL